MTLGTRIAVMNDGAIEQVAAPLDTFNRPATTFVARFVGSPAMNLWPGRLSRATDRWRVTTHAGAIELSEASVTEAAGASAAIDGGDVVIGIRPHDIAVTAPGEGDAVATVEVVEPLGAQATVHVSLLGLEGELTRVLVPSGHTPRTGDRLGLRIGKGHAHLFDASTGRRL